MWKKFLLIVILFYLFALLQNSFFTHFSLFGTTPNLVFILFFLLVFLAKKDPPARTGSYYQILFFSITAGFLLDIFTYKYIGLSIIYLIIIAVLLKKIQSLLQDSSENYPFIYFLPLFAIFLLAYNQAITPYLNWTILFSLAYNLIFATIFFFINKKCLKYTG